MRTCGFGAIVLIIAAAVMPTAFAALQGDDNGCVRTYFRGYGEGPYLFTSTHGALGVGVEMSDPGDGFGAFVVVQPANCAGLSVPPTDPPPRPPADVRDLLTFVLP
jgi:hypothetical protein